MEGATRQARAEESKRFKPFPDLNGSKTFQFCQTLTNQKNDLPELNFLK
jgi:hypothetical protein